MGVAVLFNACECQDFRSFRTCTTLFMLLTPSLKHNNQHDPLTRAARNESSLLQRQVLNNSSVLKEVATGSLYSNGGHRSLRKMSSNTISKNVFPFFRLPRELRNAIYDNVKEWQPRCYFLESVNRLVSFNPARVAPNKWLTLVSISKRLWL